MPAGRQISEPNDFANVTETPKAATQTNKSTFDTAMSRLKFLQEMRNIFEKQS